MTGGPDFLLCYYCPNEATKVLDIQKGPEGVRRWVCAYHAEKRPKRRRWKMKRVSALR